MIFAYPDDPSIEAGTDLVLRVSSVAPFRVSVYRWGDLHALRHARDGEILNGEPSMPRAAGPPWDWPPHRFPIPENWSGIYVAVLREKDAPESAQLDARFARALFVVRPKQPQSAILFNVPIFTYHAYNVDLRPSSEGTCLYNGAKKVTIARPGGGIGGHLWDEGNVDAYDTASPRQTFAHWDGPAAESLERNGFTLDYCTDLDLHRDAALLPQYRVLAAFGHHEYWTDQMRDALDRFVAAGANAAFFTGNTCWFRIRYDADLRAISRIPGRWDHDPETRTFGVSYANGGGKWIGERPQTGFTVRTPRHWVFDGTGLREGDVFGGAERVVGYECDGAPVNSAATVLAEASLAHWPISDGSGELNGTGRASMVLNERSGMLFAAGTVDWPRVLAGGHPAVANHYAQHSGSFFRVAPLRRTAQTSPLLAQECADSARGNALEELTQRNFHNGTLADAVLKGDALQLGTDVP